MFRILLSTVCKPFGGPGEGASVAAELFHAQVTRAQGAFSIREVIRCWGLDYIAENISSPSVVLHYPTESEFVKELKKNDYTHIGINFVLATLHKAKRQTELIRKHSPKAKIIYGGYGTILPEDELKPHCDFICKEEGIGFIRKLLGENIGKPIKHPYAPIETPSVLSYGYPTKVAHITSGLGCPNGCDFCCTSHFFKCKYLPFINSGEELYDITLQQVKKAEQAGDKLGGFILIDEDFFLQEEKARGFLECVRKDEREIAITAFGSVKGLSKYTADEIAEMGFDVLWIGFESDEAGYGKLTGKNMEVLIAELKARGIAVLSSMIIGFQTQDRESIERNFQRLLSAKPTLSQILIYFAIPGTPLHKRVVENDLFLPEYKDTKDYKNFDGFSMLFKHPHFTREELEKIQKDLFEREYQALGPSVVRLASVLFEGYCNMKESPNSLLRQRAEEKLKKCRTLLPAIYAASVFGPNRDRRHEARQLFDDVIEKTGKITFAQKAFCAGSLPLSLWTMFKNRVRSLNQPRFQKVEHRMNHEEILSMEKINETLESMSETLESVGEKLDSVGRSLSPKSNFTQEN
jgi:haloalkane dehalogenase